MVVVVSQSGGGWLSPSSLVVVILWDVVGDGEVAGGSSSFWSRLVVIWVWSGGRVPAWLKKP